MALPNLSTRQILSTEPPTTPDKRRRLEYILAIFGVAWLVFGLGFLYAGRMTAVKIDLSLAVINGILWWASGRASDRQRYWLTHIALLLSTIGLVSASAFAGGVRALAPWFQACGPLVAGYLMGRRESILWAGLGVLALASVQLLHQYSGITPDFVPGGWEIWFGQSVLIIMVTGAAIASNNVTNEYVTRLQDREAMVREKAIAVQQYADELQMARDEALQALKFRSEFLANMSHEIRTPLNGVVGMTRVLMETRLSAEQEQIVRTIDKSGKSLLAVINDILDFSKIEAGEVELEDIPFDLRECIEDVLDLYSSQSFDKGLELAYEIDAIVPIRIEGDVTRLRQILLNLISNAVKFTERGFIMVRVVLDDRRLLHFQVTDTGSGISPGDQERLFESFTQGDASTTRKFGGTGLGLAISKRLSEMMGGQIWVESKLGRGSTFHFTIAAEETDAPVRTGEVVDPMALYGRRCVVLGRPRAALDSLWAMAELWGMEFFVAHDDEDLAQQLKAAKSIDLAVVFDGDWTESTIASIRAVEPDLPIVSVASLADATATKSMEAMEFAAVLSRPIRYRQARHVFEAVIGGREPNAPRSLSPFDPELGDRLNLKILVAEDNIVNQQVAVAMLQRLGFDPEVAESGRDTIAAYTRKEHDVIFMDMHMPHMDGIEATRRIRQMTGSASHPWIVAMTASVLEEQKEACFDAGMNDFIGKPFEVESLIRAVEAVGKERGFMTSSHSILERTDSHDPSKVEALRELFPDQPEKFFNLLDNHLSASEILLQRIRDAALSGDMASLEMSAHTLKSSAAMFGSLDVSDIARELETIGRSADAKSAKRLYPMLDVAWRKARDHLEALKP